MLVVFPLVAILPLEILSFRSTVNALYVKPRTQAVQRITIFLHCNSTIGKPLVNSLLSLQNQQKSRRVVIPVDLSDLYQSKGQQKHLINSIWYSGKQRIELVRRHVLLQLENVYPLPQAISMATFDPKCNTNGASQQYDQYY